MSSNPTRIRTITAGIAESVDEPWAPVDREALTASMENPPTRAEVDALRADLAESRKEVAAWIKSVSALAGEILAQRRRTRSLEDRIASLAEFTHSRLTPNPSILLGLLDGLDDDEPDEDEDE